MPLLSVTISYNGIAAPTTWGPPAAFEAAATMPLLSVTISYNGIAAPIEGWGASRYWHAGASPDWLSVTISYNSNYRQGGVRIYICIKL